MSSPILTAGEMRSAEAAAVAAGTSVETLMERAGLAAAEAIWRYVGPLPALVLCGPGNNGGDGYVIARALRERGAEVRVAATAEPRSGAAVAARERWPGEVEPLTGAKPAPLLIDALFGTGLARPLDEAAAGRLLSLADEARFKVAVDLPSGAATDDGRLLSPVPDYDLTITFQTLKPSHLLQPAARHMGKLVVADIGIAVPECRLDAIDRPRIKAPGADDHKYRRGYVAVVAGVMPGAAALAAAAALRAGAGYVRLTASTPVAGVPSAVVQGPADAEALLRDHWIRAAVVGPGLGRDADAHRLLDIALACERPLVLDGDALALLAERDVKSLRDLECQPVLTPHEGEFAKLFPGLTGSKLDRARAAAAATGSTLVYKGADTVLADPLMGMASIARPAPAWLASAGTGDVLAGIIAARLACVGAPFHAACEGVWLHGRAAERAGPGLIADDLLDHLPAAVADCL